ncbi:MAG: cytidylyltransferase domain-containing protein, partial [bacterium]
MRRWGRNGFGFLLLDIGLKSLSHPKIADHVIRQGGNAMLTSAEHISGTDRIAEIARRTDFDLYINVQGDEPFIEPKQIEDLLGAMVAGQDPIATQCRQIADPNQLFDYNVVKVVRDKLQRALYFSRQAIPAFRDKAYDQWLS